MKSGTPVRRNPVTGATVNRAPVGRFRATPGQRWPVPSQRPGHRSPCPPLAALLRFALARSCDHVFVYASDLIAAVLVLATLAIAVEGLLVAALAFSDTDPFGHRVEPKDPPVRPTSDGRRA